MLAEVPGRIIDPPTVNGMGMIAVASLGAAGNAIQHRIISAGEQHDTTHGLVIHILTDLVASIGIIVAGA
jgi:Co/Zn/Cd efflux system component